MTPSSSANNACRKVFVEHPSTAVSIINCKEQDVIVCISLEKPVLQVEVIREKNSLKARVPADCPMSDDEILSSIPLYVKNKYAIKIDRARDLRGCGLLCSSTCLSALSIGIAYSLYDNPLLAEQVACSIPEHKMLYRSLVLGGISFYTETPGKELVPTTFFPPPPALRVLIGYHKSLECHKAIDIVGGLEALRGALSMLWEGDVPGSLEMLGRAAERIKCENQSPLEREVRKLGLPLLPLREKGWFTVLVPLGEECSEEVAELGEKLFRILSSYGVETYVTRVSAGGVIRIS